MPHAPDSGIRDRMRAQFVEADFEIGFSLVDLAEAEAIFGNYARAAQILKDADNVFLDARQILSRLKDRDRDAFAPLLGELRRAINLAKSHVASPH